MRAYLAIVHAAIGHKTHSPTKQNRTEQPKRLASKRSFYSRFGPTSKRQCNMPLPTASRRVYLLLCRNRLYGCVHVAREDGNMFRTFTCSRSMRKDDQTTWVCAPETRIRASVCVACSKEKRVRALQSAYVSACFMHMHSTRHKRTGGANWLKCSRACVPSCCCAASWIHTKHMCVCIMRACPLLVSPDARTIASTYRQRRSVFVTVSAVCPFL